MTARLHAASTAAAVAVVLAALAGCAGVQPGSAGAAVEAPAYRVGDRWVYHVEEGYRVKNVWEETHEVIAIGADGVTVRVTQKGPSTDLVRTEQWSAPGRVRVGALCNEDTRRFTPDLTRYDFPLVVGKTWNQWVHNIDDTAKTTGDVNHYAAVLGWDRAPAGGTEAIQLFVIMHLDDETFWRYATECRNTVWYSPSVRGIVREVREARYLEKGSAPTRGAGYIVTLTALADLVSFTPGK
jgi:hypothetical protein